MGHKPGSCLTRHRIRDDLTHNRNRLNNGGSKYGGVGPALFPPGKLFALPTPHHSLPGHNGVFLFFPKVFLPSIASPKQPYVV
jgi:hypothetical protein